MRDIERALLHISPPGQISQPQVWLGHSHRLRADRFSKPIEDGGSNVQFVNLALERA